MNMYKRNITGFIKFHATIELIQNANSCKSGMKVKAAGSTNGISQNTDVHFKKSPQ
jgi:hypothetical protein